MSAERRSHSFLDDIVRRFAVAGLLAQPYIYSTLRRLNAAYRVSSRIFAACAACLRPGAAARGAGADACLALRDGGHLPFGMGVTSPGGRGLRPDCLPQRVTFLGRRGAAPPFTGALPLPATPVPCCRLFTCAAVYLRRTGRFALFCPLYLHPSLMVNLGFWRLAGFGVHTLLRPNPLPFLPYACLP
jgi:hypothetical protein